MLAIWRRVPTTLGAVILAFVLLSAGAIPWAILARINLRTTPAIPWSAAVMAVYLWVYWRYAQGAGWPAETAEARRRCCRTFQLPIRTWVAALLAGVLGLAALIALLRIVNRLVRLPTESASDVAHLPLVTLAAAVVMSALVAGVVEEIAFRGYLQGTVERRHGVVVSILVCGALFAAAHFTRPETTLALVPYYMAVAAVYGALAYLTNSVLPSIVLHTLGNIAGSTQLILGGRSEWQASRTPAPLVWTSGLDAPFWLAIAVTAVLSAAAVAAYVSLARIARVSRSDGAAAAASQLRPG